MFAVYVILITAPLSLVLNPSISNVWFAPLPEVVMSFESQKSSMFRRSPFFNTGELEASSTTAIVKLSVFSAPKVPPSTVTSIAPVPIV